MGASGRDTRSIEELRSANAELQRQLDARTAELHEKNERYALVSDAVAEGVYDWNIEQNTLFVSPRLMEMFGLEGPGLKSQAWFALVHEADREAYRNALRDCFKGDTPKVGCEYRILLQSGEYRWVEDHGLPIRDTAGRAIRLVGAVSDVTERKKADEALRDTSRLNEALLSHLNAVIDTIDYGVCFMGPDLRARVINRAFRQMWGIPDAFIATRPTMADLINFNRHTGLYGVAEAEFGAFIARRVEAIQAGNIDPVEMRRGDGRILRYQGVVLPDGGRLLTYLDITEAKRREAELSEALAQQTATAEVLAVINSSPGDLVPVFDAILDKAHRLCGATQGTLQLYDGTHFRAVATHGLRPDWAEAQFRPRPPTNEADHELLRGARLVHYPDLAAVAAQYPADARMRSAVASGVRTILRVPLRREGMLLGYISAYREEVKPFSEQEITLLESFAQQAVIAMENARLITETREALEQQTATAEVLGVINASPGDLQPVFEAILDKAHSLCGANIGWLLTFDGEFVHTLAMHGLDDLDPVVASTPFRPGPAMERLIEGESFFQIPDITEFKDMPGTPQIWRVSCEILGTGSYLIVPLRKDGTVRGFINAFRSPIRLFSEKDIALLQNFAAQAVIAMENARLITETREALDQQTATAEVLQVINSSPGDLVPVFNAMLERAVRLCEAASGIFWTYDGTGFRAMALHGVSDALVAAMRDTPRRMPTASLARIAAGEDVVRDDDLHQNAGAERAIQLGGMRTGFLVALKKGDALLGAIRIFRQDPRPFADKQIAVVKNFAAQAVIAMENARLITETRQRTDELQEALAYQTATGEVLRIVASSPDRLAPVFDAILDRATELCGVDAANLYLYEDGLFQAAAAHHPDPKMVADMLENPIRPGPGTAIYRAFTSKAPVHIADIADAGAYGTGNPFRERMVARGVRAVLIVPLVRGDEAIGAVTIYRPVPEPYTEAQIELVRTFADQAVVAIENARLFGELRAARDAAEAAYKELQTAQSSLVQAQKMAALGQLTAGIAHEIKNPLNFVNNFAGLSTELLDELKEEMASTLAALDGDKREAVDETIEMLTGNLDKIAEHGRRADNIVKSMLEHSRGVSGEKRLVDLNALVDEALNLAYHGARAQDQTFNITLERDFAETLGPVGLAPQEMTRVFLNLFGNGFYAAHKRAQANGGGAYRPILHVATRDTGSAVEITIRDNGTGIPAEIRDKLFQPFFTTKPTGEGTGLGLSISYDIVTQQHGGTIDVASEEGAYTEFTIRLPRG